MQSMIKPKLFFLLFFCLSLGCSSKQPKKVFSLKEKMRFEQKVGINLAKVFEKKLEFVQDQFILSYLTTLGEKLYQAIVNQENISISTKLMKNNHEHYFNSSLPGNRIYISLKLLGQLKYENQLAASMAIEVARILKKSAIKKIYQSDSEFYSVEKIIDFDEIIKNLKDGSFQYTDLENAEIIQFSIKILYLAGFDPRGLLYYFKVLQTLGKHSPYSEEQLQEFIEVARREIVKFPPLLNPTVGSEYFNQVMKRVKKL